MHFCSLRLRLSLLICSTHSTQIWSGHLFHTLLAMILIRRCLDDDLRQRRRRIREQRQKVEQQQQQQMVIRRGEQQRVELQTAEQSTIAAESFAIRVARPPQSAAADPKATTPDPVLTRQRWYRAVTAFMALCLLFEAGGLLYVRSHYSVDLLLAAVATLLAARSAWIRGLARMLLRLHILQSLETQAGGQSCGTSAATEAMTAGAGTGAGAAPRSKNCNASVVSGAAATAAPHRHSSAPATSAPPDTYSSRRRLSRRWCALSCVCAQVENEEEEEERRHGEMAQRPSRPPVSEPQAESAAAAAEPGAPSESAVVDISERKQLSPPPFFARTAAAWSAVPLRSPLDPWPPTSAPPAPHAHPPAPISAPSLDRHTAIDVEERPHSPPLVAAAAAPPLADQPAELEPETDPAALSAEQLAAGFPTAWIRLRRSRWALRYLSFPIAVDFEAKMARVAE